MKANEALKILDGDFSEITLAEGENHSDKFAEAFQMAKEALKMKAKIERDYNESLELFLKAVRGE